MKRLSNVSIWLIISILAVNCKDFQCKGDDAFTGDIIDHIRFPMCNPADIVDSSEWVIRSRDDLEFLISGRTDCDTLIFDFTEFSLIGQRITGGCTIQVSHHLNIDDSRKQYIYTSEKRECGTCKQLEINERLAIVPAIPDDYTVIFKTL